MIRSVVWFAVACSLMIGAGLIYHSPSVIVYAQDGWKAEFDDICAKTADSISLSTAEIKDLIERCDRLKPLIEKLDETTAKVYLKRLQMCKDLYVFVLVSRAK